jgi:uncharacterized protein (TIGR03435 family)
MEEAVLLSLVAVFAAIGGALSGTISIAQQPQPANSLQFEVAAIKRGNPKLGEYSHSSSNGSQFRMENTPLKQWVEMGLSVSDDALKAPSWLDTSRFDLNAKFPEGIAVDKKAAAEMMKSLLVERFGMKWHEENGTVSGYELVTDKKVLVQPTSLLDRLRGHGSGWGPSSINGTNMPMSELAKMLGDSLGRPVVDATHLTGGYDVKLMWRPSDDAVAAEQKGYGIDVDNLPSSIFTALREQLGLRLQNAKVPSRIIVVDSINRHPAAN